MRIRLFGGVSAVTDLGDPADVGPGKCQAVLAALALSAGSAVPVSRLVAMVWGEDPPRTAEKTLQSYVTRLRKGLGHEAIARPGAAYRLDVDAGSVDVLRFQRRLRAGDVEGALAEWTGTPLAGLDAPGLDATVAALVEQWLGATQTHLERLVETDAPAAIGPLTELVASHPFREGLWALLMTALYRAGRQADALAAFHQARQHLVEQLGVEPGPRLRELESAMLAGDPQLLGAGPSTGTAPARPTGTVTFGFVEVEVEDAGHAAMARLDVFVNAAADAHGGHVFATGSESFGVAFHRPADASAWVVQLQAAVRSEPWPGGVELRPRIGVHTGEAEQRATGYFGPAVHVAARLAAVGHGGQSLVSGATAALLDRGDLRDLGTFRLDGVVAEQRIFQLGDDQHPPLRTDESRRGNLPRRLGRLIGRDEDLKAIGDALATSPVVTLVGPGGIGKTRLALAAARMAESAVPDGAWLIELAEIAAASDVPRAVADALDVTEHPGRTLTQSIVTALRTRTALVVVDNCEHVIDGAAAVVRAIVEGCVNVQVLATSRERLGVPDEHIIAVAPLEPSGPGVELFNERALAASPTFDPGDSRNDVEEICRRLDGVPLAIELAAARARTLAPSDLVARLDDRLRLLAGGRRTGVEHHRTLRATIQWSYDLLTPAQQVLLERLSIFAGPFDLNAAETVAADDDLGVRASASEPAGGDLDVVDVDHLLGDLVDRSMLIVESGPFGQRFRLLETMRQFAAEHLAARGDTDLIAARHATWCAGKVTHIHHLLGGHGEIEGVARLAELWTNLRAAFDWACATDDRELAEALVQPVVTEVNLRRQNEIGDWAERILGLTPPDDQARIVFWLTWAAYRYMQSDDHDAYDRLVRRYGTPDHPLIRFTRAYLYEEGDALRESSPAAVAELRRQGEEHGAALTELAGVASGLLSTGQFDQFDAFVATLASRYRAQGPPTFLSLTLVGLAYSALFQGKLDQADQLFDEMAGVDVPERTLSVVKPIEARAAFRRGNRSRAFRILRSHIGELVDTDSTDVARLACVEFITMMVAVDRLADAARMLGFLETTGQFGVMALQTVVANAASRVAASNLHHEQAAGRALDTRHALAYMRDVLGELADDQRIVM